MTNDFFHGVQGFLTRIEGKPVTAVRSSVIAAVVTAGKGPVNKPTLIFGNLQQAYNTFGPFLDDGFTAGMTAKGVFDQIGTLMLFVNVCDPEVHNSDIANEVVSLARITGKGSTSKRYFVGEPTLSNTISAPVTLNDSGEWTIPAGITVTGVKNVKGGTALTNGNADGNYNVANGKLKVVGEAAVGKTFWVTYTVAVALAKGTDYTVDSDKGEFTRLNTSAKLLPSADITVNYTYVDPTKVTSADIIGLPADGEDSATGIMAVRAAPTMPGITTKAKILIAPGFSDELAVAQALNVASRRLNGRVFIDSDDTTYESAVAYAQNFAGDTDRVMVHYPNYFVPHPTVPNTNMVAYPSIWLAGLQAKVDKVDGKGDPYVSLSNKNIVGITGLTRPVEHTVTNLNETDGESLQQFLNSQNVTTTIYESGWRVYGNRQANGDFLCVMRMADYVLESAVLALIWAVDKNINGPALPDQMLTQVRQFLRALEARGSLVANPDPDTDNDVWFPPELNTADQLAQGHAYLNFRMNPPPPLERLTVTGELTHEFLKNLFQNA